MIDLRSDTVTRPTDAMRAAMAAADVGDDVYGEDPTVRRLEEIVADRLGKQSALFFPTGTMANQVAIHLQCGRGEEALVESMAHSFDWEMGAAAALSGVQLRPVSGAAGVMAPGDLAKELRPRSEIESRVALVILENTHNMAGGTVWPEDTLREAAEVARGAGAAVHLDGARLANAEVASGVTMNVLAAPFDTVMISLSKGLSAPAGSLLAGPADLIREARRVRKMFGGSMRQAGVLAAAGIVALQEQVGRLDDDHRRARRLAEGLTATGHAALAFGRVDSNIVVLEVPGFELGALQREAAARGIRCGGTAAGYLRLVTHRHIDDAAVDEALGALGSLLEGGAAGDGSRG
jgi:threonine aldolase